MKISVIIPTYNGAHKIINILKALENQTIHEFETIVVIDGSTDNTADVLKHNYFDLKELKIIERTNGGRSVSRNTGVRQAQGDVLIFFDDDMRPTRDCVALHVQHHILNQSSAVVGSVLEDIEAMYRDIQFYKAYLSRFWSAPLSQGGGLLNKDNLFLTAANFSIPKSLFLEVGGFDERLTDAEDFDLGVRLFRKDIKIYFNEKAIAWHDDFITCESYIKRLAQYKRAHTQLKQLKPDLYQNFNNHQPKPISLFKKAVYKFFSFPIWISFVDKEYLKILPKNIRYKMYDVIITSHQV